VKTVRAPLSSWLQAVAKSASGTDFVLILNPFGTVACSSPLMASTRRFFGLLPRSLPTSSRLEEHSPALQREIWVPLIEPTCTKRSGALQNGGDPLLVGLLTRRKPIVPPSPSTTPATANRGGVPSVFACLRMILLHLLALGSAGISRVAADMNDSAPLFTRAAQEAVIPAEVSNHVMTVTVTINGQGPFRMLVDTGCSFSMISPEVADAVEARGMTGDDEDVAAINGLGDVVNTPRVVLDSIVVGSIRFEGVIAGVVPLELQSKIDGKALDGILGYTLFSDLFVGMDYKNQRLRLSEAWPKDLPPVRAELVTTFRDQVPFITVNIQNRVFDLMVDTGANDRVHLEPAAAATLRWKVEPRAGVLLAVAGETARERIGRASGQMELGRLVQPDPVIEISAGSPTIGIGVLQHYVLLFHPAEAKLWLLAAEDGPIPSPPEVTIGLSLFAETNGWRVAGIIPDSPAETAGIKPGDLLTMIEGMPARQWTRDQLQAWIETHPTVSIRVTSGAAEHDYSLRSWNLIP